MFSTNQLKLVLSCLLVLGTAVSCRTFNHDVTLNLTCPPWSEEAYAEFSRLVTEDVEGRSEATGFKYKLDLDAFELHISEMEKTCRALEASYR